MKNLRNQLALLPEFHFDFIHFFFFQAATKEGFLMKQTWTFQRWRRRYFRLKGHKLFYAKSPNVSIRNLIISEPWHVLSPEPKPAGEADAPHPSFIHYPAPPEIRLIHFLYFIIYAVAQVALCE